MMKKLSHSAALLIVLTLSVFNISAQGIPAKSFGTIYQETISWSPFPAFPPEARLAILVGEPKAAGPM